MTPGSPSVKTYILSGCLASREMPKPEGSSMFPGTFKQQMAIGDIGTCRLRAGLAWQPLLYWRLLVSVFENVCAVLQIAK